jgi:hypothetical protein
MWIEYAKAVARDKRNHISKVIRSIEPKPISSNLGMIRPLPGCAYSANACEVCIGKLSIIESANSGSLPSAKARI